MKKEEFSIKGQYSVEFLIVSGFVMLFILLLIPIMNEEYNKSKERSAISKVENIVAEIGTNADKVYFQGAPSRIRLSFYFPPGIIDANFSNKSTFYFRVKSGAYFTDIPYTASMNNITSVNLTWAEGIHHLMLIAVTNETFNGVEVIQLRNI